MAIQPLVRRIVVPALWGLRAHRGTALLLAITAATALVALLPITSLVGLGPPTFAPRLALAPVRGGDLGMSWSSFAWTPGEVQHSALVLLFRLLLGVAAGVLGIAGLTLLSVSAARATEREVEVRVRRAVGASRRDVFAGGLLEIGLIAAAALCVGGASGAIAARLAVSAWTEPVGPATSAFTLLAIGATLGGMVLGTLLPLALPRRTSPLPGASGKPLQLFVPALQLGLSLTVLGAATLLQREAARLTGSTASGDSSGEIYQVSAVESRPRARAARYADLLRSLAARRVADPVSLNSPGALVGLGMVDFLTTDCGNCSEGGIWLPLHPVQAAHYLVSSDTFRVLGLSVVSGRGLRDVDDWTAPRVAVVSHWLASHHFEGGRAIGRGILIGAADPQWYRVVGVVDDQRPAAFGGGVMPLDAVYLSVLQHPAPALDLYVRTLSDSAVAGVLDGMPVSRVTAGRLFAQQSAPLRWFERMLSLEGWVIFGVATLGSFVVMRLWIASLLYEVGMRRSVGARRRHVMGYVLRRAAGVAIGGIAIGLWGGLFVWGAIASVAAGVPAWDPRAALQFAPLLVAAALIGALWPAWSALRVPPARLVATALRS